MGARSYAIVGTGAVGGLYGARLARAGLDVHFLLHSDYEHVARCGLVVESKDGDFALPKVNAYRRGADLPPCDVTVVAMKTTQNRDLPAILPHSVKPGGAVLVLQNGLGAEDDAAAAVGPDRILGGLCFLCSTKPGPGHIRHLDYGQVRLGAYDPNGRPRGITPLMREVAEDFGRAGFAVDLSEHLLRARWQKLFWNIPFNALTILLDATTDRLLADPGVRAMAEAAMREIRAAAAAHGCSIPESFIGEMISLTLKMTPYQPSMKTDFDARRPMEVEAIFGNPVRAARKAGVATPLIEAFYGLLAFLDARSRGD